MKALTVLAAVLTISTQGCASMLENAAPGYGSRFGEIQSDRPSVVDGLKGGQTALPGFGATPNHHSVPQNIPLPAQANPRVTFMVPSLGKHTVGALFGGFGVLVEAACSLTIMSHEPDPRCEPSPAHEVDKIRPPAASKGPVILR